MEASLAEALLPCVGDALSGRERLSVRSRRENVMMGAGEDEVVVYE